MAPWLNRNGSHQANDVVHRPRLYGVSLDALPPRSGLPINLGVDHGGDSSSSESETDIHPSRPRDRPRRSHHSRSMSHPFPSLFSGRKKKQAGGQDSSSESESGDNGSVMSKPQAKSHRRPQRSGHGGWGSQDFANGNCMTCGSLVRWPKDLRVFRCIVCLTINDMVPRGAEEREDGLYNPARAGHQSANTAQLGGPPSSPRFISTSHTRQIIRKCLVTFLERTLKDGEKVGSDTRAVGREAAGSWNLANKHGTTLSVSRAPDGPQQWKSTAQPSSAYIPSYVFDEPPTLRPTPMRATSSSRSYSSSYPDRPPVHAMLENGGQRRVGNDNENGNVAEEEAKRVFKPLEDYIINCFSSFQCVNSSFSTQRKPAPARAGSGSRTRRAAPPRRDATPSEPPICNLDPKLLLLGDFAENGSWWTGGQEDARPSRSNTTGRNDSVSGVTPRSPQIEWGNLRDWYMIVTNAAEGWRNVYDEHVSEVVSDGASEERLRQMESRLLSAQHHTQRVLLKATEMLLKRPGRLIAEPGDLRFLLIALHNPLLHADARQFQGYLQPRPSAESQKRGGNRGPGHAPAFPQSGPLSGHHSGVIKRILGLMSNSSGECHNHLVSWFARLGTGHFREIKDLVGGFLTYRLLRGNEKKPETRVDVTAGLIPNMNAGRTPASLHSVLGGPASSKSRTEPPRKIVYSDDWQIRAASVVMALFFAANNLPAVRRDANLQFLAAGENGLLATRESVHAHGQILPTSDFYNSLIDYADLVADFEAWEAKRGKFAFCQYPFLLSISAKTKVLEHEAKRQMLSKARDAFFDSIMTRKNVNQFLVLDVRRDCLVEDSLKTVSEIVGSGSEDIQKRLRIVFTGEEGVDHGGLRKEWFLLLVREVFNPDHGMFVYDEDSQYCYFNPNSFETSDQFFLVGVVMGLAIYNSTILDVPLPPFAFRKLIASGPAPSPGSAAHPRPAMTYTLDDLAEFRPSLARGLNQLLEYDGDVEEAFSLDFVVDTDRYGTTVQVPLCPGGERKPVKNSNRREYVDLYVRHLLDTAVSRQFEPFKRGFYTVCSGNALSLFRPEEIELLVRGSDEALDIASLRAVATYENWGSDSPDGSEPVVEWFWATFDKAAPADQRKLLLFITGSDRIPAMGASMLHIKISCLGDDCRRYPIARTCFNVLALWRYPTQEKLESMLWTAVYESEGFGLK